MQRIGWLRIGMAMVSALLVLFIAGPVLRLLVYAAPTELQAALADPELRAAIALTLFTATAATLIGLTLGLPLAYALARTPFRGRHVVTALLDLPIVLPHPVAGLALLLFLGRQTAVGRVLAFWGIEVVNHIPGIIAAMLFVSVPLIVHAARDAFRAVDPQLERVARSLGDNGWQAFRRITLPLAGRGVLTGAVMAWARSVSEFGAIVILTYNPKVASVYLYDRFTLSGLPAAIPAAAILLLVSLAVLGVVRFVRPREPA